MVEPVSRVEARMRGKDRCKVKCKLEGGDPLENLSLVPWNEEETAEKGGDCKEIVIFFGFGFAEIGWSWKSLGRRINGSSSYMDRKFDVGENNEEG